MRGNRARHASAVRVRILGRANCVEALRHHALEVRMRDIDFRIDHRDRDIGATDHAVDVGNLELLQHVLRGIALWFAIGPRGGIVPLLLQGVEVVRLRHSDELDGCERANDFGGAPPVGDAEARHGRAGDGEVFRGEQRQSETSDRGLQSLHRDIACDLEHDLVLDEAGLGGRRNVDNSPVEAGRQLLLLPLLRAGRSRRLLLRRQSDAALDGVEHRRRGGVERGKLNWTNADEIIDDLHRPR
jgi:hypothetical protein